MQAVLRDPDGYDPSKSKYTTYVNMVVGRRLIDLWRVRSRRAERERVVGEAQARQSAPGVAGAGEADDLAEWLAGVYATAKRLHGAGRVRRGRKWYNPAQAAACLLLRDRLHLSYRGMELLFRDREDLRRAIHLTRCPSYVSFLRFCYKFNSLAKNGVE